MELIDSHSHIYCEAFDDDRDEAIARARDAGVTHIVMPNENPESVPRLVEACRRYPGFVSMTIGLHPEDVDRDFRQKLDRLQELLPQIDQKIVAIGEIGIDLYWDKTWREQQLEVLDTQLRWSKQLQLPFIIHCRDAFDEILFVLKNFGESLPEGVFHSFAGTEGNIKQLRRLGDFYFGVNGIVTFKKSNVKDLMPVIGINRLLLETDSPYLAPVPHRGKRNESAFVADVARFVASHLAMPVETIAGTTADNAKRLFNIDKNEQQKPD